MPEAPLTELVAQLRDLAADPADGVTDADLLHRYVRDRDAVAFEALVWRHARLVMGVCRRQLRHHHDAEDAFQATFLLLARKAHQLRRGSALSAWLHTTAVRVSRRAAKRRRPVVTSDLPDQPTNDVSADVRESWAAVDDEVQRLPARLRVAFVLCELEGRTHAAAAVELGRPKGTIDSRVAAATRRLRERLVRRGVVAAAGPLWLALDSELIGGDIIRRAVNAASGLAVVPPAIAKLATSPAIGPWVVGLTTLVAAGGIGLVSTFGGLRAGGEPSGQSKDEPTPAAKTDVTKAPQAAQFGVRLVPKWKRTTIGLPPAEDIFHNDVNARAIEWLSKRHASFIEGRRKSGRPMIPPAIPAVANGAVIYAHDGGVAAFCLKEIRPKGVDPFSASELFWNFEATNALLLFAKRLGLRAAIEAAVDRLPEANQSELIFNRTLGATICVRGDHINLVDDVGLPFPGKSSPGTVIPPPLPEEIAEAAMSNRVLAVELHSGKVLLKLDRASKELSSSASLGENHYLAAPLTRDGRWHLLHEKNQRLWLTCFRWDLWRDIWNANKGSPTVAANSSVAWHRELVASPTAIVSDPHRRIHAIHLVEAGELILCPTHLGRVVAVEAKTGKVRWRHEYAPIGAKRFESFAPEWVVVPPVVAGDKYIYAPADFPELLCINVTTGKKVWSVKKGDGLYPAVIGDRVLIVGEKSVRALGLKDGSEQWKLDLPGLPCGRGALLGDTYLVPVSEPKTWRGMIAVVDLKAGKIAEVLKPDRDEPIGNLVVHQEFLISQTLTEIAVFPIKKKE